MDSLLCPDHVWMTKTYTAALYGIFVMAALLIYDKYAVVHSYAELMSRTQRRMRIGDRIFAMSAIFKWMHIYAYFV